MFNKEKEIQTLKLVSQFQDDSIVLENKQTLLGAAPTCDIVLPKEFSHYYHAAITMNDNGVAEVLDFNGDLGVFINGEKVVKGTFSAGDVVKVGGYEFYVEEAVIGAEIVDFDSHLNAQLCPVPVTEIGHADKKYTIIDGEACYIDFSDEDFQVDNVHPGQQLENVELEDYVYDLKEDSTSVIKKENENRSLEIMALANGMILSVDYIGLKDNEYFFTGKKSRKNQIHLDILGAKEKVPCFRIEGGEFIPKEIEGFNREMVEGKSLHSQKDFVYHYSRGPIQIFIRPAKTPPLLRAETLFERDKAFWKEQARVFGTGIVMALMLLFINTKEEAPVPEKVLAVVYKKIPKKKMVEKQTAQLKQENKTNDAYKKVITKKSKGKPAPAPKKIAKTKPRKPQKTKKAPAKTKVKAVAKVETYKSPFKSSINKLFAKSGAVSDTTSKSVSTATVSDSSVTSAANKRGSRKVASFQGKVGDLGKHSSINSNFSSGAKGLADKRGIVTASASTKTVVLGAMDPEILRKILEEYIPQFRHCYQQELEFNSDKLKGVVDLQFTITKVGKASKIKVLARKTRFSRRGTNCMASVLKIIDFPKPKGGGIVDVRQPLNFFSERG